MPKSCCVVGCSNHNMKDKKLSFHIFPIDPDRQTKWVNTVKRVEPDGSEWTPTHTTVLCGEHFLSGKNRF
uniref:THAP-type domain-containing protein n=1 Tax=Salarias fasciatus TaxID=181472 RepID=A0A672HFA8_SALFA